MDTQDIDFGTTVNEPFETYIIRVGDLIDKFKASRNGTIHPYLQDIIIGIFESKIYKSQEVYHLLKYNLKREPTVDDLSGLVSLVRQKLNSKLINTNQTEINTWLEEKKVNLLS